MACCDDCERTGGTCGDAAKKAPAWSVGASLDSRARVGADPQYPTTAEQAAYDQGKHDGQGAGFAAGTFFGGFAAVALTTVLLYLNRGKVLV